MSLIRPTVTGLAYTVYAANAPIVTMSLEICNPGKGLCGNDTLAAACNQVRLLYHQECVCTQPLTHLLISMK